MRLHGLLPSLLGALSVLCLASPVEAARLQFWRFDANGNRLTFTTDEGVQPRVQLVSNPTRLVIDLPDTTLGRSEVEQSASGAIRVIRIAQFDASTTRIVIELNPGYTIDPEEVSVRGRAANQWIVQLPDPEPTDSGDSSQTANANQPDLDLSEAAVELPDVEAVIEEMSITADGFFIRLRGEPSDIDQDNDRRPRRFTLELEDTALAPEVVQQDIEINRYGVSRVRLVQDVDDDTSNVEVILELEEDSPRWRAIESDYGGIVLVPREGDVLMGNRETQSLTSAPTASTPIPVPAQPIPAPIPDRPPVPSPLPDVSNNRIVITIDPGHGGRDPGAVGIGNLHEADVVLDISLQVADLLEAQGVQVILTRQDDREVDLEPRVQVANRARSNLFVSIHANAISMDRPDVNGLETYYYSDAGQRFAQVVHDTILERTESGNRGVKFARFYVLRNTSMPAILIEVGFVTGEQDAPRLADPEFRTRMAEAIAAGILRYVQQNL